MAVFVWKSPCNWVIICSTKRWIPFFLQSCLLEQKPVQLSLKAAIPVLVFYTLVQPQQDGSVRYLQDTYQHFQKKVNEYSAFSHFAIISDH